MFYTLKKLKEMKSKLSNEYDNKQIACLIYKSENIYWNDKIKLLDEIRSKESRDSLLAKEIEMYLENMDEDTSIYQNQYGIGPCWFFYSVESACLDNSVLFNNLHCAEKFATKYFFDKDCGYRICLYKMRTAITNNDPNPLDWYYGASPQGYETLEEEIKLSWEMTHEPVAIAYYSKDNIIININVERKAYYNIEDKPKEIMSGKNYQQVNEWEKALFTYKEPDWRPSFLDSVPCEDLENILNDAYNKVCK